MGGMVFRQGDPSSVCSLMTTTMTEASNQPSIVQKFLDGKGKMNAAKAEDNLSKTVRFFLPEGERIMTNAQFIQYAIDNHLPVSSETEKGIATEAKTERIRMAFISANENVVKRDLGSFYKPTPEMLAYEQILHRRFSSRGGDIPTSGEYAEAMKKAMDSIIDANTPAKTRYFVDLGGNKAMPISKTMYDLANFIKLNQAEELITQIQSLLADKHFTDYAQKRYGQAEIPVKGHEYGVRGDYGLRADGNNDLLLVELFAKDAEPIRKMPVDEQLLLLRDGIESAAILQREMDSQRQSNSQTRTENSQSMPQAASMDRQDRIDAYLTNQMTEEESASFKKEIENDPKLKEEVVAMGIVIDAIRESGRIDDDNEKLQAMRDSMDEYVSILKEMVADIPGVNVEETASHLSELGNYDLGDGEKQFMTRADLMVYAVTSKLPIVSDDGQFFVKFQDGKEVPITRTMYDFGAMLEQNLFKAGYRSEDDQVSSSQTLDHGKESEESTQTNEKAYRIVVGTDNRPGGIEGEFHVDFGSNINAVPYETMQAMAKVYGGSMRITDGKEWADFYDRLPAEQFADKIVELNEERLKAGKNLKPLTVDLGEIEQQVHDPKAKSTNDLEEQPISGLEDYSRQEIHGIVRDHFEAMLENTGIDAEIVDMKVVGSRARGTSNDASDLDIILEYKGGIKEDALFNILNDNEEKLHINGIPIDINPITESQTGTLAEWVERDARWKAEDAMMLDAEGKLIAAMGKDGINFTQAVGKPLRIVNDDQGKTEYAYIKSVGVKDGRITLVGAIDIDGEPMAINNMSFLRPQGVRNLINEVQSIMERNGKEQAQKSMTNRIRAIAQIDEMIGNSKGLVFAPLQPILAKTARGIPFEVNSVIRNKEKGIQLHGVDSQGKERFIAANKASDQTIGKVIDFMRNAQESYQPINAERHINNHFIKNSSIMAENALNQSVRQQQAVQQEPKANAGKKVATQEIGKEAKAIIKLDAVAEKARTTLDMPFPDQSVVLVRTREQESKRFVYQAFGEDANRLAAASKVKVDSPEIKGEKFNVATIKEANAKSVMEDLVAAKIAIAIVNRQGEIVKNDKNLDAAKETAKVAPEINPVKSLTKDDVGRIDSISRKENEIVFLRKETGIKEGTFNFTVAGNDLEKLRNAIQSSSISSESKNQLLNRAQEINGVNQLTINTYSDRQLTSELKKAILESPLIPFAVSPKLEKLNDGKSNEVIPSREEIASRETAKAYAERAEKHGAEKSLNPDAMVLLKMNATNGQTFYQTFGADAQKAADILGKETKTIGKDVNYISLKQEDVDKITASLEKNKEKKPVIVEFVNNVVEKIKELFKPELKEENKVQFDIAKNIHAKGIYDIQLIIDDKKVAAHHLSKEDRDAFFKKEISPKELVGKYFEKELAGQTPEVSRVGSDKKEKAENVLMETVNGQKVTNARTFTSEKGNHFFSANLDGVALRPQPIDEATKQKFDTKQISVEAMMQQYYPTKLMAKVPQEEFRDNKLSNGKEFTFFKISKDENPESKNAGKYVLEAVVDGKRLQPTPVSYRDLNEFFDGVTPKAKIVERTMGEQLHIAAGYEKYKMPEGAKMGENVNVRVQRDDAQRRHFISAEAGGKELGTKMMSYDDAMSYRARAASKEQLGAKYFTAEIKSSLAAQEGMSQKNGKSRAMSM